MEIGYFLLVFLFDNFATAQGQDIHFPDEDANSNVIPINEQSKNFNVNYSGESTTKGQNFHVSDEEAINRGQNFHFPDDEATGRSNRVPISEQKCNEYNKPISGELVGTPFVVGGSRTKLREFPFMAAVGWRNSITGKILWKCGGTLISEKFVLTAAHCCWSENFGAPALVRLGEHDLWNSHDNTVDFSIRIIKHPSFEIPYNDIALLELNRTVSFSKWIRPACLWNKKVIDARTAIATGWGWKEEGPSTDRTLLKVELNIFPNSQCAASYETSSLFLHRGIVNSMLCAGDLENPKDTCRGDSGGPLFLSKEGNHYKFYQIGITSFALRFKNARCLH